MSVDLASRDPHTSPLRMQHFHSKNIASIGRPSGELCSVASINHEPEMEHALTLRTYRLQHGVAAHDVVEEGQQGHSPLVVSAEAQEHRGTEVGIHTTPKRLLACCTRLH